MEASDMKELRVILDNINVLNDEWFDTFPTDEGQTSIHDSLEYEIVKADKILAKRPRNCDVGTVEKRTERFSRFCLALREICEYIESFRKYIMPGKHKRLSALFAVVDTIYEKARAALAAPARNCDRFGGDYKMLHTAWFDWTGSPSGQNPDGTVKLTFAEWLLEIAEVHHA